MRMFVPFVLAIAIVANVGELVGALGQEAKVQTVVLNVSGMS
jgi:hypothetical protein